MLELSKKVFEVTLSRTEYNSRIMTAYLHGAALGSVVMLTAALFIMQ